MATIIIAYVYLNHMFSGRDFLFYFLKVVTVSLLSVLSWGFGFTEFKPRERSERRGWSRGTRQTAQEKTRGEMITESRTETPGVDMVDPVEGKTTTVETGTEIDTERVELVTGECSVWQVSSVWQVITVCDRWVVCDRLVQCVTGDYNVWQVSGVCDRWVVCGRWLQVVISVVHVSQITQR